MQGPERSHEQSEEHSKRGGLRTSRHKCAHRSSSTLIHIGSLVLELLHGNLKSKPYKNQSSGQGRRNRSTLLIFKRMLDDVEIRGTSQTENPCYAI